MLSGPLGGGKGPREMGLSGWRVGEWRAQKMKKTVVCPCPLLKLKNQAAAPVKTLLAAASYLHLCRAHGPCLCLYLGCVSGPQ